MDAAPSFRRNEVRQLTDRVRDFPSLDESRWLRAKLPVLTTTEVAAELGVSASALRRAIGRGRVEDAPSVIVEGFLRGRAFTATRTRPGRGVPWAVTLLPLEPSAESAVHELRERMARQPAPDDIFDGAPHASLPRRWLARLASWRPWRRGSLG